MRSPSLTLLLAVTVLAARADAQTQATAQVSADQVRLRAAPSTSAKVVAILDKATTVTVLESGETWTRVRMGFTIGYVHSSLLTASPVAEGVPAPTASPAPGPVTQAAPAPSSPPTSAATVTVQAAAPQESEPSPRPFSIYGGLASGSGGWGIGFGAGVAYAFPVGRPGLAVRIQGDAVHFQDSGRGFGGISADATQNIFGAAAVAEYTFRTSSRAVVPYLLGGLGFYFSSFSYDITVPGYGSEAGDTSDSDVGLALGGGVRFGGRFFAELRVVPFFSGGSMVPIMAGVRF